MTSAKGQKETSDAVSTMSALPPKADIARRQLNVRFVPKADIEPLIRSARRRWSVESAARLNQALSPS
jgi:hypothetical protein